MHDAVIGPALSAEQWHAVLANADALEELRASFAKSPFTTHALAALFLVGQPYGFTPQDVGDEREVADYCEVMSRQHATMGDARRAAQFFELAGRHRVRAEKIAALLPPVAAGDESTVPPTAG